MFTEQIIDISAQKNKVTKKKIVGDGNGPGTTAG